MTAAACVAGLSVALASLAACRERDLQPVERAPAPAVAVEKSVEVASVVFEFRSTPIGNLTYQLDCLAELVPCSHQAYAALWQAEQFSAEDRAALDTWKALRSRYTGTIEDDSPPVDRAPLPLPRQARRVQGALRVAGFGARDVDEYLARIALFASAADVTHARAVLKRFSARAQAAWPAQRAQLATAADGYAALAAQGGLQQLVASIAKFYRVDLPAGSRQAFELVWRPVDQTATYAQQLGQLAVIEVMSGDPPRRQYPIVLHEVFHGWFGASPIDKQLDLAVRFARANDPYAGPGYGLLDEAVATALGNGLVQRAVEPAEFERRRTMPEGLYADPLIDAAAKALLPELEAWLGRGQSIYDEGFVAMYLRALHTAFPHGMPVVAYLRPLAGATQDDLPRATQHLSDVSGANHIDFSSDPADARAILDENRAWGTAILLTPAGLAKLTGSEGVVDAPTLGQLRKERAPSFVLVQPRQPIGTRFVMVAADDAAMIDLIDKFVASGQLRAGVWRP